MSTEMKTLENFQKWLIEEEGLSKGSTDVYLSHVRKSLDKSLYEEPKRRLLDKALSPKSLHLAYCALLAWGKFINSEVVTEKDAKKLPPNTRLREDIPLDKSEWIRLRKAIVSSDKIEKPVKAILLMLALRGFRIGDVLRMERDWIIQALKSDSIKYLAKRNKWLLWPHKRFRKCLELLVSYSNWKKVSDLVSNTDKDDYSAAKAVCARSLKTAFKEAKLDVKRARLHLLRATYATLYYQQSGNDIVKLVKHMGWGSVSVAFNYVNRFDNDDLESIADKL